MHRHSAERTQPEPDSDRGADHGVAEPDIYTRGNRDNQCYDVTKTKPTCLRSRTSPRPPGAPAKAWPHKFVYDCEATRTTGPLTALEQKALAASRFPRKDLAALYEACAENDPDDVYAEKGFTLSKEQVPELRGWLIVCPKHPNAKA